MAEKKSLVEETLLQMKDLENVISENAKGILQSTMKEEIGELVKESLMEQDVDDTDVDDTDVDDTDVDDTDVDDTDVDDTDVDIDVDAMRDIADEPIDLTKASDEEILKVFKGMSEEDGIIIKKDGNTIDLEDTEKDVEYKIQMGESEEDIYSDFSDEDNFSDENNFSDEDDFSDEDELGFMPGDGKFSDNYEMDEIVYEIEMDEQYGGTGQTEGEMYEFYDEVEDDEIVYEIEMDESDYDELDEESDDEIVYEMDDELDEQSDEEDYNLEEAFKAKGLGIGKSKFKYSKKPNQQGGFKEKMKQGPKSVGTGSAKKFSYGQGENAGDKLGKNKIVKKSETKEAARTYGNGSKEGRGLRKGITPNRNFNYGKGNLRTESQEVELNLLREKNEEYRKALNLFRGKLNEVAVFNSNLAYATRLFTEHSTTKQEKINILRRFDAVETLKESKTLYKAIKDELSSQSSKKPSKESIQEQIERTPSSGSAASLIESKTYENPQFMRMKDLMVKMNIKN